MDLKHLRTFVAVAEVGSVSKAAQRLRVAQPALSRQIIDLESDLGLALFDRVGRRLFLTTEGEQLLGKCRGLLDEAASIRGQAQLLRRGDTGRLKVAASPQILESVLSKFLIKFAGAFPHVEVSLAEAVGRDQLGMLERRTVDISIGLLGALKDETDFASYPLPGVEVLAASHPSIALGQGTIEITRLAGHPLLVLSSGYHFRTSFDAACRLAGLVPNISIESQSPHTLLALAEAGQGVAIIQTAVPLDRYKVRTFGINYRRRAIHMPMAAIWIKRRGLPGYAERFCTMLAEHMRDAFPIARPSGT